MTVEKKQNSPVGCEEPGRVLPNYSNIAAKAGGSFRSETAYSQEALSLHPGNILLAKFANRIRFSKLDDQDGGHLYMIAVAFVHCPERTKRVT